MTTNLDEQIKRIKPRIAKEYKVKTIGYFGSYARGEQTAESDVDILVEFSGAVGLKFIELQAFLEQELGKKVDLVTPNGLKPAFKQAVLNEVIYQ